MYIIAKQALAWQWLIKMIIDNFQLQVWLEKIAPSTSNDLEHGHPTQITLLFYEAIFSSWNFETFFGWKLFYLSTRYTCQEKRRKISDVPFVESQKERKNEGWERESEKEGSWQQNRRKNVILISVNRIRKPDTDV